MTDRDLFCEALDITDRATRSAFLRERATDPSQYDRVVQLIASHAAAGDFLEQAADHLPATLYAETVAQSTASPVTAGTLLAGKYRLVRPLGQGGMGVVWQAEQIAPIARSVAVKLIRPGLDSSQVLARFDAERQALARMDHPHIATVYDGGTTSDGRPFVVMELVLGEPLSHYCDARGYSLPARLELFEKVCLAVHHAHQRGVIHRDIKPSNVLVADGDSGPTPKIIDFGVAKATGRRLTDQSVHTCHGTVLGTPQYMSPEQAGLDATDVDTRADIYSLGAVLYELLTGRPPFDTDRPGAAGLFELIRSIRDEDPVTPSLAVGDVRHAQPLRGELDWIVMKCLQKNRERRYETAKELAGDVRRYLTDEPVSAGPPSTFYVMRKLVRRHRRPVAVASVILLTLVLGVVGTTAGFLGARRAEADARTKAELAERRYTLAQEAVDKYLAAVTEDQELQRADHFALRTRLLASALPFYEQLAREQPNDPDQRAAQGRAYYRHADLCCETGQPAVARTGFEAAYTIFRELTEDPGKPEYALEQLKALRRITHLLGEAGEFEAARTRHNECLKLVFGLYSQPEMALAARAEHGLCLLGFAGVIDTHGESASALRCLEQARDIFAKLTAEQPDVTSHLGHLAVCHNNAGNVRFLLRDWAGARHDFERAIELIGRSAEGDAGSPSLVEKLAGCRANLGRVLAASGDRPAGRRLADQAAAALHELCQRFPTVRDYQVSWAGAEVNAASMAAGDGPSAAVRERLTRVIAKLQSLTSSPGSQAVEFLSNAYAARAEVSQMLDDSAAGDDWDRAVETASPYNRPIHRSSRAVYLARTGEIDRALSEAELLVSSSTADVIYNVACVYAVVHGHTNVSAHAERATHILRQAIASGYLDMNHMKQDPDLRSLQDRLDFRILFVKPPFNGEALTNT